MATANERLTQLVGALLDDPAPTNELLLKIGWAFTRLHANEVLAFTDAQGNPMFNSIDELTVNQRSLVAIRGIKRAVRDVVKRADETIATAQANVTTTKEAVETTVNTELPEEIV